MRKFRIDKDVFELFPSLQIGVLVFSKIDNCKNFTEAQFDETYSEVYNSLEAIEDLHPYIEEYRNAMKNIIRKKGSQASIDAMVKRIKKGNRLRPVNPVVDIYNYISLKHLFTCGGEDLDHLMGDMILGFAEGDESFIALGDTENKPPRKGELIYRDDYGAVVRSWLWREADRTKITNDSKNVLLYLELVDMKRIEEFRHAISELDSILTNKFGCTGKIAFLSKETPECSL